MTSIVYMATNRLNGKRYIGVTSHGLAFRRRQHEQAPNAKRITCRYFHAAMKKYGAAAFDWTVLVRCATFEEGLQTEVRLIAEMKPEYNLTAGGQGTKGHKMTPEGRARWLEKMVGRKLTAEHIAKCADARRGQKRTPEQRARIAESKRGKPFSEEHKANLKIARARQIRSQETREKQRQTMKSKGWKPSSEMMARSVAATKGQKRPRWIIDRMRDGLVRYQAERRSAVEA